MFSQNKNIQLLPFWLYTLLRINDNFCSKMVFAWLEWCWGSSIWRRYPELSESTCGARLWQFLMRWFLTISLVHWGGLGGLQGRQHLLSMKIEQPLRGKFGSRHPRGKQGRGGTWVPVSHGLKFIDALLRVALSDLAQRFVFISARFHILGM